MKSTYKDKHADCIMSEISREIANAIVSKIAYTSDRRKTALFDEATKNPEALKYVILSRISVTDIKKQVWEQLLDDVSWKYIIENAHRAWFAHLTDDEYAKIAVKIENGNH